MNISINSYNFKILIFLILMIFISLILIIILNNDNREETFENLTTVKNENQKNAREKLGIDNSNNNRLIIKGEKGDKGDKGSDGIKGDDGNEGKRGITGKKGNNASPLPPIKFIDKETGEILGKFPDEGYPSIEEQAKKGIQEIIIHIPPGKKGDSGEKGKMGQRGSTGSQGTSSMCVGKGDSGKEGKRGYQGEKGEKGVQGEKGEPGIPGTTATEGLPGVPGMKGAPAMPPKDGKDGAVGPRGQVGPVGPVGPAGPLDIRNIPRNKRKEHRNHHNAHVPFIKIEERTMGGNGGANNDIWFYRWGDNCLFYAVWHDGGSRKPGLFHFKSSHVHRDHPEAKQGGHRWQIPNLMGGSGHGFADWAEIRDGGSIKIWVHRVPTGTKASIIQLWWDN